MDKRKIIYYEDELQDEFSVAQITSKKIDGKYVYLYHSPWKRFTHFFWYRIIATPVAFLYTKITFHHKVVNRSVLRQAKGKGYFLYGNHTQDIGDAFMPHMMNFPRQNYTVVHPNNVSIPIIGHITPSLGALPLPDDMEAYRNFRQAIEKRIVQGHAVVIYPEAHIWPYYIHIRPFPETSFAYPVKCESPVFCFVNTYQKRRIGKKPRIVTYIDGPFYADKSLASRQQAKDLRDRVYTCMCEHAKKSTVEQIRYVKKEKENG